MARLFVLVMVGLALAVPTAQAYPRADYRSDAQAEHYVEHGLARWAGLNLKAPGLLKFEFCLNGYYSTRERRTRRHFHPVQKISKSGEPLFRSFACTLTVGAREFRLYLVTLPHGRWAIGPDR